ncbi:MAG: dCMP deaminase family protein [Desulfobulbaceae bacterium]|jgi:dCMP deaminase|nr:dCMP deaminase family protein [Desulfobulbaceae bacterium]
MKRQGYLSWDEYFMAVALLSAQRSKDPNTQVGACIVNERNRIVGVGYNGLPRGLSDDDMPWSRDGDFLASKYAYVCHAELNAVLNAISTDLRQCRIYVTLFPCNECVKIIMQSAIREIVYLSDKYRDSDAVKAAKAMLDRSPLIGYRQFTPERDGLSLSFAPPEESGV